MKPTIVLIDTPYDEDVPESRPRSRSTSPRPRSSPAEDEIHVPDEEVYGLKLLQRVITEAHLRNLSKLVVPIPVISKPPPAAWSDESPAPALSPVEQCAVDPALLRRCIDLGAADVVVSPINAKCMAGVGVQAYKAYKEAARQQRALMDVRKGRKLSWVGVNQEKPFAYLREAMVSNLMKGICRLGGEEEGKIGNFKLAVPTERKAVIGDAVGRWHFSAHDFTDDELLVAAMLIFKHALKMPELEKWRISTGELTYRVVTCKRGDLKAVEEGAVLRC